jgi:hypothetical protein
MKLNRIGSLAIIAIALVLLLSQSASEAVKAQVNGNFSANLSQPAKTQNPTDQTPYKVTVQGRLTDPAGNPITSQVNVTFKLYSVASGGSAIFSEGPTSVTPDTRGLLTYQLGSSTAMTSALVSQFANSLYLGITVGTDSEMSPRILLTAAPYALSLAVGATALGNYDSDGTAANPGTINGINTDVSNFASAGLYGKGMNGLVGEGLTGVYGHALPTGLDGIGGHFTNDGNGPDVQFGVLVDNYSSSGTDGYGGSFYNLGGGNGNQYGIYATTGGSNNQQQVHDSIGAVGVSTANSNTDYSSTGGVFTSTNTFQGVGAIGYGTTGLEGFATTSSSNAGTNGGYFYNNVGNSSRDGIQVVADGTSGGLLTTGGEFSATGGSNHDAYGVAAGASALGNNVAYGVSGTASGNHAIGGYFTTQAGDGILAETNQPGYAAIFNSDSSNAVAVRVNGRIQATSCCAGAGYDIQVRYHGTETLHAGDILAADGVNETFQGVPTLGVLKATSANADAAIGVVQYPIHKSIADKNGQDLWKADPNATSIQPGELATAVVLGQIQVHTGSQPLKIGTRLTLDASGNLAATKGNDNIIGKVVSQPDNDGYVTVFVNLK